MRTPNRSSNLDGGRQRHPLVLLFGSRQPPPPLATAVVRVHHPRGLHARAGVMLSRLLARFDADVQLSTRGVLADARSPQSILMLGAGEGDAIAVQCRGRQAVAAMRAIEMFFALDSLVAEQGP